MTLVLASGYQGITDPDAATYITAVEAADGQAIEGDVAFAVNDFVVGCKADGIWDAIKASCILAGARTLSGALVPLKGTAPNNFNFVSGDYDRKTGLKGNGSTKYLNSNRNNNADPQNNNHNAAYVTALEDGNFLMGATGSTCAENGSNSINGAGFSRNRSSTGTAFTATAVAGFFGMSRNLSTSYTVRAASTNETILVASSGLFNADVLIYRRSCSSSPTYTSSRLSFYSIGESIDLEKLDNRTTRLMNLISYSLASGLPDLSTMDIDAALYIGAIYRAGGTLS